MKSLVAIATHATPHATHTRTHTINKATIKQHQGTQYTQRASACVRVPMATHADTTPHAAHSTHARTHTHTPINKAMANAIGKRCHLWANRWYKGLLRWAALPIPKSAQAHALALAVELMRHPFWPTQ
jgi:hypothetical protein